LVMATTKAVTSEKLRETSAHLVFGPSCSLVDYIVYSLLALNSMR
jgi:hypothetical protein